MTKADAINKVINIALDEVGYLEKKTNSQLDSKTSNAGSANFTKYWRDIKPSYQRQPWCACFVTWCFVQAFGVEIAKKLLKHYPYVYCPTMASLFTLNTNPKAGDIVIFKRNGTFVHTGIVTSVNGDYFTTVEGNTSGGNSIVANGGGVFKKGYYNSRLPGTKFCTPDWTIVGGQPGTEHWAKEFLDKLKTVKVITDESFWMNYDSPLSKAHTIALLDKATGGLWTSPEANASIHWAQPNLISLCGKKIITDYESWLSTIDANISKALLLALVDNATGGMKKSYQNRNTDHWGRNHLDSLCEKGIITNPSEWTNFDREVSRGQTMALVCKALYKS